MKCDCGAKKARTLHADWCQTQQFIGVDLGKNDQTAYVFVQKVEGSEGVPIGTVLLFDMYSPGFIPQGWALIDLPPVWSLKPE